MKLVVSALLVGASMLANAPASAADFIKYSVAVTGTKTAAVTTFDGLQQSTTFITETGFSDYEFLVPVSAAGTTAYNSNPNGNPDVETRTVVVTPNSLILDTDRARSDIKFLGLDATVTLCGTFSTIGGAFTLDPSCSTASSTFMTGNATTANTVTRYAGAVTAVRTSLFSSSTAQPGFLLVPVIPEPATWALMLVGFGMAGAALRGAQRGRVACG